MKRSIVPCLAMLLCTAVLHAEPSTTARGDAMIAAYFKHEAQRLHASDLAAFQTLDDWKKARPKLKAQLREMLGLEPWPERTPLQPQITGRLDHEQFTVEKIHFQSRPGLYVTGNLYIPKNLKQPAPTILYVCGHAKRKKNGISYGNKAAYQHHGIWFARHGYVCLTIDTLQLGEIEGIHHGTYRHDRWWWNARGYTPAGVEAWNCIRALDYLETRPEVDKNRFGITGRSGGGSYSWWTAALDERIQVAVPVAGITDLINHVADGGPGRFHDGVVEGHCDCMYPVNTYGWDFGRVAAMVAPRALLISNSDKDSIFPLEGVVRVHAGARQIYRLQKANDRLGLQITEGPHKDTQELRVHAFSWFNRFLKNERPLIAQPAVPLFTDQQLKVFETLPTDERNTRIDETFVPHAKLGEPIADTNQWTRRRAAWMADLQVKSFGGWPKDAEPLALRPVFDVRRDGIRFAAYDFNSQSPIQLRLYLAHRAEMDRADLVVLNVLDDEGWRHFLSVMRVGFAKELADENLPDADAESFAQEKRMHANQKWAMAYVAPRGVGPSAWNADAKKQTQHRRRFMLLGQTLDGMRVWDVRRATQALRQIERMKGVPTWYQAHDGMAGVALYASLFERDIARLDLWNLPASHHDGPIFLNVLRFMDTPAAVAMAAQHSTVRLYSDTPDAWRYAQQTAKNLSWPDSRLKVRQPPRP